MTRLLAVIGTAVALTAALIAALTWPGEAQQRTARAQQDRVAEPDNPPPFDPNYTAGMRIIHVPQAREAAAPSYQDVDAIEDDNDVEPAPPAKSRPRAAAPQPRRVLPPAGEPKRTMLSPPQSLSDGPSPIRPLPQWRGIEKFTEPPKSAAAMPSAIDDDDDAPPPAD